MKEFLRQNVKKCKKTITVYTMPDGFVIEAYKHKNQTDRIGLPNFISYIQKIMGVMRKNFA